MKIISSFMRKWYVLGLEFLVVFFSGFLIWNSEKFQETISPQKYWNGKVHELENEVKMDHWRIRKLEISLEREKLAYDLDVIEAEDKAKSFEEDIFASVHKTEEKHQEKIKQLREKLQLAERALSKHLEKLKSAKDQLSHKS